MNAYRQQQLAAARLIEQGADAEQVAEVYGWIRGEPERSGTTGHNQTMTVPRKCGIIQIARHVCRRIRKHRRAKTMKNTAEVLNDTIRAQIENAEKELEKAMKNLDYEKAGEIETEIESLKIQLETPIPERKICF